MNGIHEVTGSTPVWSTNLQPSQQHHLTANDAHDLHSRHVVTAHALGKSVQISGESGS